MSTGSEKELKADDYDDVSLQQELTWGLSYRDGNPPEEKSLIDPKHSPMNVPFKLCRLKELEKSKRRKKKCPCEQPKQRQWLTIPSLLDRSALSQDKYMELLSIPKFNKMSDQSKKRKSKRKCCKCEIEPCAPRLVQMAVPKKRRVWENWKAYQDVLPAEVILRFDQILRSGNNNLEPKDARYYFKEIDRKKKKERMKKLKVQRQKCKEKVRQEGKWMKEEVNALANAIVQHIKHEPYLFLNFKQMKTSNEIVNYLNRNKITRIYNRDTKDPYKKSLIEISDKIVKWVDNLNCLVNAKPLTSKEEIGPAIELESLLGEEEEYEEYEEEEEEEGEEEEEEEEEFGPGWGAEEEEGFGLEARYQEFIAKKLLDKGKEFEEYGGEESAMDFMGPYDQDTLDKLINVLSKSTPDFLNRQLDDSILPDVTHNDILDALKDIRDGQGPAVQRKSLLEDVMVDWAKHNDPEQVDDKLLDKIHETSGMVEEMLGGPPTGKRRTVEGGERKPSGGEEGAEAGEEVEGAEGEEGTEGKERLDTVAEESEGIKSDEEGGPEGEEAKGGAGTDEQKEGQGADEEQALKETTPEAEEGPSPEEKLGSEQEITGLAEGAKEGEDQAVPESQEGAPGEAALGEGAPGEAALGAETLGEAVPGVEAPGEVAPGAEAPGEIAPGAEAAGLEVGGEGEIPEFDEEGKLKPSAEEAEGEGVLEGLGEGEGGGMEGEEEGEELEEWMEGEAEAEEMEGEGLLEEEIEGEGLEEVEAEKVEEEIPPGEGIKEVPPTKEGIPSPPTGLEGYIIKGHKPSQVFEHSPDTICCLSLKIWAVWLLEIAHNAHSWTKWIAEIIKQVKYYASIIRGDVLLPNGEKRVLYKEEWRQFVSQTEEKIIAWRQYSAHVKDLSTEIVENFHGKKVNCCPKCLQDHMIKNVVTAHDTLQALTEAINCAEYWQRCLDRIVEQTSKLTGLEIPEDMDALERASTVSAESQTYIIEEMPRAVSTVSSGASLYEIEEIEPC